MPSKKTRLNKDKLEKLVVETRRNKQQREKDYREKALKIFPWICARCGREFEGKKLRELTVHHKDHNHDNNPSDGSNWELLCLYCHDNEHSRYLVEEWYGESTSGSEKKPSTTYKPFADLEKLIKDKT
ncbi:MAG: YajD family HNH nuclease [Desulfobacterales bacterium]|nr:YajD family HNH nuclease [Desulfobacterales bacterium]